MPSNSAKCMQKGLKHDICVTCIGLHKHRLLSGSIYRWLKVCS